MQIFNFRDGHMTTFWYTSLLSVKNGHRLCRLAKGTLTEFQLSIGTIGLGVKLFPVSCAQYSRRVPKTRKMLFESGSAHAI